MRIPVAKCLRSSTQKLRLISAKLICSEVLKTRLNHSSIHHTLEIDVHLKTKLRDW
jgi:hypothetical protein